MPDLQYQDGSQDELVFLPLGGSGEIGMNLNLFGYGPPDERQWIMVDLGVTFGDERTPGVDLIMPDPEYILQHREQILGLVLTHGHEDHIGAVGYLWHLLQCPIYATPFTAALIRNKLEEAGVYGEADITIVPLGGNLSLGPFDLELITITHSIPEPNALAIRTPLGCILHTGDWKIDPAPLIGEATDIDCLRALGDQGVRAMICDSTNVLSPGTAGSEAEVRASLTELMGTIERRIAVTCFASNVARLETVAMIGAAHDRHVCLVGRSMNRMVAAAHEVGLLKNLPPIVSEEDAGYLPPDKVLYICTGSQGEPRAALSRIASGTHPNVVFEKDDTVIFSSRIIPGNELAIYELQNQLAERGIRIITERDHFVHVSGHPCRDDLTAMYQWVRPELAIPVHGEARHLIEHAALAKELQVPETIVPRNGSMVRIAPGEAEIVDEVAYGRLYLDGRILMRDDESHLRDRRKIAVVGYIAVTLVVDGRGRLLAPPEVIAQGIPEPSDLAEDDIIEEVEDDIDRALNKLSRRNRENDDLVEQTARLATRRAVNRLWGKKPVVDVRVVRV